MYAESLSVLDYLDTCWCWCWCSSLSTRRHEKGKSISSDQKQSRCQFAVLNSSEKPEKVYDREGYYRMYSDALGMTSSLCVSLRLIQKKKPLKKKKDLGSLVIWIRQKTSKSQPCSQHMCPHSYTPRQHQCFVKVTHAKNKMWCLSPKELCKLKQANQKLLVPPSKSKTYSAVVLLPSAPANRLICHICHYPISSVWLRQTPLTAAKTPHSHVCLHTVKHAFSK